LFNFYLIFNHNTSITDIERNFIGGICEMNASFSPSMFSIQSEIIWL